MAYRPERFRPSVLYTHTTFVVSRCRGPNSASTPAIYTYPTTCVCAWLARGEPERSSSHAILVPESSEGP
eukprot:6600814-Pyramimonas_sp.AAC.2